MVKLTRSRLIESIARLSPHSATQRASIFIVALALLTIASRSHALYPYSCGNLMATPNGGAEAITATDALAVLKGAIAGDCPPCICDVDKSLGNPNATDGLKVLKHAVGGSPTLICPADETNEVCTQCTCAGLLDKLQNHLDSAMFTEDSWIIFGCADNTVIDLDHVEDVCDWPTSGVQITANNVVISGVTAGKDRGITLKYDDDACECSGGSGTTDAFLTLAGDNGVVSGLTVIGFDQGVTVTGKNCTIGGSEATDAVDFESICGPAVTNLDGGIGTEVRGGSFVDSGCGDSCTSDWHGGTITASGCDYSASDQDRGCYHIAYHDVTVDGCEHAFSPIEDLDTQNLRMLVSGGSMTRTDTSYNACDGILYKPSDGTLRIEDWDLEDCTDGIVMNASDSKIYIEGILVDGSKNRGLMLQDDVEVIADCNTITDNGGNNNNNYQGGIVVRGSKATPFFGDTSNSDSLGKNHIAANHHKLAGVVEDREILYKRSGFVMKAQNNYWGGSTAPNVGTSNDDPIMIDVASPSSSTNVDVGSHLTDAPSGPCP